MTADIQAAKDRLTDNIARLENEARALEEGRERHGYGPNAKTEFHRRTGDKLWRDASDKHAEAQSYRALLAELSRLEGENERLQADNDVRSSCLRDTQLALAEARRQIAERDEALLSAAKYLVRMENALLKDDLDMKLDFPGEEGPSAFATTLVPDFDVAAYELELFAGRAPPPTGGAEPKTVTMLVDQDWLSRHVATDPDASVEAGPDVLAWLSENRNVELSFDYGDADDDGKGWCVHRVNGGVNDREWTLIGTGETPLTALRAALQRKGEAG